MPWEPWSSRQRLKKCPEPHEGQPGAGSDLTLLPQAFREELSRFREKLDTHKGPVSCALVALMAHGGPQGQLLGADGEEVQPEVLMQELSCCEALHGHPKIFLLQACRGGKGPCLQPNPLPWHSSASHISHPASPGGLHAGHSPPLSSLPWSQANKLEPV